MVSVYKVVFPAFFAFAQRARAMAANFALTAALTLARTKSIGQFM
jgi:hypothetical protein